MKKRRKWMAAGALLLLLAGGALLLWRNGKSSGHKNPSLIYIPKTEDGTNDFWTLLISGTRMAAAEYGASLTVLAPETEQDVGQQEEYLRMAIEEKPDAILISPSSLEGYEEAFEEAKKAGIPLVFVDSYTSCQVQDLTVATDNLEAGRLLGEYARSLVDAEARIAVVSHVKGVSTAVERERGFREGLGSLQNNIVEVVYCDSLFEKAEKLAAELMEKYPDLEMIAGMNEYSSVGAARAVKKAGAQDHIRIVGVDSSQEAVQLMEQGIFQGLVVQKAFKMGFMSVKETIRMLQGERVERVQDSGCQLVTPENMYSSEIEKLLFPFDTGKNR
ncbi:MAG: substrate-binding domain-containing protein [Eubacteriales bacterium]|nr:substrate-binding domain-containing protein [Eubacteriales bacterium]